MVPIPLDLRFYAHWWSRGRYSFHWHRLVSCQWPFQHRCGGNSPFFADPPDFLDFLFESDFIIHEDDAQTEDGFLGVVDGLPKEWVVDDLPKEWGADQSILEKGQVGKSMVIVLKQPTNFQSRLVLYLRCDYIPPPPALKPCQPFDDGLVGFQRTRGKEYLFWRGINQRRDLLSCSFYNRWGLPAILMGFGVGVPKMLAPEWDHGIVNSVV